MAKRNAKKQATSEEIESSDPVCRELALLADRADVLLLTLGADYDTDDAMAGEYDKRLVYLPVLLAELTDWRVRLVLREENKPDVEIPGLRDQQPEKPKGPSAHEGSHDATSHEDAE